VTLRAEGLNVAGVARRFLWAEPSGAASVIVLGLHGSRLSAERQARLSSMERLHPEAVRVLGAVAGLRAPGVTRLKHPVRVLAFHGTADRINPFEPGSRLPLFPISLRLMLGRTPKEIDATDEIWRSTTATVLD
jgi:poly(3-hydroxybutyrate) depolymerase